MQWKQLAFLSIPLSGFISLLGTGYWTFSVVIFAFVIVPTIELFLAPDNTNFSIEIREEIKNNYFINSFIYIVLPLYLVLLYLFLSQISNSALSTLEIIGMTSSAGIICGVMGINVGHELGHRRFFSEKLMSEVLLILSMQAHFLPYHNFGHHRYVATPNDHSTARKNETVFHFWLRSQFGSYFSAWEIEWLRLTKAGIKTISFENKMIRYSLGELVVIGFIYYWFGISALLAFGGSCLLGMLLLETVNYIEHYGLLRKEKANGKYERVNIRHSWNSNHQLGRVLLFELSRHSDHHAHPSKPYMLLDSHSESPHMPTGYPGMMLLSLIPALWFRVMNSRLN